MIARTITAVALTSATFACVDALTVRQATEPTDVKVFCESLADKAACNVHEFCSYKDDKSECDKLNSWIKAINDPACVGITDETTCEANLLCTWGKNTLRCKGDNDYLVLDAENIATAEGIVQPSEGSYVHTSAYCRTFSEADCGQGDDVTVCEWELAREAEPATEDKEAQEAKPAQCGNKKKTNEAANALVCAPNGTPLEAADCAADMRCELGLASDDEKRCKPSDQIIVVV